MTITVSEINQRSRDQSGTSQLERLSDGINDMRKQLEYIADELRDNGRMTQEEFTEFQRRMGVR